MKSKTKNKSLSERAREHGLDPAVVYRRKHNGWAEADWFKPLDQRKSHLRKKLPKVKKPKAEPPKSSKIDDAESGFILTLSVMLLGAAVVGLLWLVTK